MSAVRAGSDATFAQMVLQASGPVLVDFHAAWCGPCRRLAPALESLAARHGDKVAVVAVDIDDSPVTAGEYEVMSVPTLLLFRDGQVAAAVNGVQAAARIERDVLALVG